GRAFEPRNSPTLLNAGSIADSMFWDRRVRPGTGPTSNGTLITPAGAALPGSVTDLLAAQAMMPVTSRLEMRGEVCVLDVLGNPNELAALGDTDFTGIWQGIMARLLAIPAYVTKFGNAFPGVPQNALGFEHAAAAIAAFEKHTMGKLGSPF